jgi:hypothetical protein
MNVYIRRFSVSFVLTAMIVFSSGCFIKNLSLSKEKLAELKRQRIEHAEEMVRKSPDFQEVDKICKEIPLPESSKFVSKGISNDAITDISYYYLSSEKSENIRDFYFVYFKNNGWEIVSDDIGMVTKVSNFKKEPHLVIMQLGGMGSEVTYAFNCIKQLN